MTTPPPNRKISTGNPCNLIQTSPQIKALAKAAASSSKQQQQQQQIELVDEDSSTIVESGTQASIQRSSSHESHLRNKVNQIGEQVVPSDAASSTFNVNNGVTSSSKTSLMLLDGDMGNGPASRRLSEASEMSSRCASSSGHASPNLQSPSHLSSSYKSTGMFADDSKSKTISNYNMHFYVCNTSFVMSLTAFINCDLKTV